jgi:aspartate/methionine/tyrosine aminotransferase
MSNERVMGSEYMNWAKTSSRHLATSGVDNLSLKDLKVSLDDLEITDGGYGYAPLVRAIAERYRVNTESIVTAAGTSFANHLAMAALVQPGDEVLFEQPAYEPMLATVRYLGADVKRFPEDLRMTFESTWPKSEARISNRTRLIVGTQPSQSSGVLTEEETLHGVDELCGCWRTCLDR